MMLIYNLDINGSQRICEIFGTTCRSNCTGGAKVAAVSDNGVSQAGFYVLVGASMPSVLIEVGYLSNPSEERYLRSNKGQQAIARGIGNAIVKFKNEYEKTIDEN
jgi:N-acetylmuramoyl-L-alanine amidase